MEPLFIEKTEDDFTKYCAAALYIAKLHNQFSQPEQLL